MRELLLAIIGHGKEIDGRIKIAQAIGARNSKARCLNGLAQIIRQSLTIGLC